MDKEILDNESSETGKSYRLNRVTLFVWFGVIALGLLFKLLDWAGSSILLIGGSAVISAYSFTAMTKFKMQSPFVLVLVATSIVWICMMIYGALTDGYPYNVNGLGLFFFVFVPSGVIFFLLARNRTVRQTASENKS